MSMMAAAEIETASIGLVCSERTFPTWDSTELFFRAWLPPSRPTMALLLFHRGHEHSGRFQQFVEDLGLTDVAVFAWDARGHGRSPGERGYATSYSSVVRDMEYFARFIEREYGIPQREMIALGHSVGAVGVAAWVHDYAPPLRAMILVTPAFRVKLYIPLALPALRLRMRWGGRSFIKSYVRAKMLTHDPEQAAAYEADPLISRNIATNVLIDLHDLSTRLLQDAGAISTPTLLLGSGSDWVVKNSAQRQFFDRLSSPIKQMEEYPGFHHAILHEKDRDRPIARIRQFIVDRFQRPSEPSLTPRPDEDVFTRREYDALSAPLSPVSPKRWNFVMQRLSLKSICRLSDGIRLGWRRGFDSGESLDYVYRNQPRGISPFGKLIDRFYLNSIGWRGVRLRKAHLCETLEGAIRALRRTGAPIRIVDIAAGPGRYLLETLERFPHDDISAVLRDRSAPALEAGRALAAKMKITNVSYREGDAFDRDALAAMQPRPNIAIASGLYELFADNTRVGASLAGMFAALQPGGYLIYTNQPWHPQLEMIARVLINREGKPWIMRRRPQAEMDQLVRAAGFEKMDMKIDSFGIFTVSLARKPESP
jgi:alpha-beta hydrolase superfamily lysophospholipase/SAM-dependent methyltransferase